MFRIILDFSKSQINKLQEIANLGELFWLQVPKQIVQLVLVGYGNK